MIVAAKKKRIGFGSRLYRQYLKRLLDIVLSLTGLALLWWLFLILAVLIRVDDPGPAFFRQKRMGKGKKPFEILKFRTMKVDAPRELPTRLMTAQTERYTTRLGRFLRKSSLDELPQLWNILKGEMSFVGPRPVLWNEFELFRQRDRYGANDVTPGLTGLAQINGRDELSDAEKAHLDGIYCANITFRQDLECFLRTFGIVIEGKGILEAGENQPQ